MAKLMGMMDLYREELKAMARSLDQEGLSQTAIAKELGVPRRTVSRWFSQNNGQATQAIMAQTPTNGNNGLATATHSRYLVVCQSVEKLAEMPFIVADGGIIRHNSGEDRHNFHDGADNDSCKKGEGNNKH